MKNIYLILIALLPFLSFGQAKYVDNELILQIENGVTPEEVIEDIFGVANKRNSVKVDQKLSSNLNVWLLKLDQTVSLEDMIQLFQRSQKVVYIQKNHLIERRVAPNDTHYPKSWHHKNTGSNGPSGITAVAGADLDSEKAWNLTKGGKTKAGDEIVVCVIDDGIEIDHEDLKDNIWKNKNEIPGNNIDDDGNGYKDDITGWNAYSDNGGMKDPGTGNNAVHGMKVSGMVGAKGNNGKGVVGVNWDVKIMTVVGGGNEAAAIKAYDYPLTMRKLYNKTNGAKGAYVVSTNASWGTDFGKPSDAPIWCAMYDSLGKAGVINMAATTNSQINIDNQGDLPTTCPSFHLIGVTNSQANDKLAIAGYGVKNIDIAAPGEWVWTTIVNNGYGADKGTSFAAPVVAGAVGLIYSHACKEFIHLSKTNPQQASLRVRNALLAGVDKKSNLASKVSSGGRINLYNTLIEVNKHCWELTSVKEVTENKNYVSIMPNPVQDKFTIEVKQLGNYDWSIVDLSGRIIREGSFNGNRLALNIELTSGVYFFHLKEVQSGEIQTKKFIAD